MRGRQACASSCTALGLSMWVVVCCFRLPVSVPVAVLFLACEGGSGAMNILCVCMAIYAFCLPFVLALPASVSPCRWGSSRLLSVRSLRKPGLMQPGLIPVHFPAVLYKKPKHNTLRTSYRLAEKGRIWSWVANPDVITLSSRNSGQKEAKKQRPCQDWARAPAAGISFRCTSTDLVA